MTTSSPWVPSLQNYLMETSTRVDASNSGKHPTSCTGWSLKPITHVASPVTPNGWTGLVQELRNWTLGISLRNWHVLFDWSSWNNSPCSLNYAQKTLFEIFLSLFAALISAALCRDFFHQLFRSITLLSKCGDKSWQSRATRKTTIPVGHPSGPWTLGPDKNLRKNPWSVTEAPTRHQKYVSAIVHNTWPATATTTASRKCRPAWSYKQTVAIVQKIVYDGLQKIW